MSNIFGYLVFTDCFGIRQFNYGARVAAARNAIVLAMLYLPKGLVSATLKFPCSTPFSSQPAESHSILAEDGEHGRVNGNGCAL